MERGGWYVRRHLSPEVSNLNIHSFDKNRSAEPENSAVVVEAVVLDDDDDDVYLADSEWSEDGMLACLVELSVVHHH